MEKAYSHGAETALCLLTALLPLMTLTPESPIAPSTYGRL
jgi:hypothetical protein